MLPERDQRILEFEAEHGARHTGVKEAAIMATFGVRPTRYYQRLNRLLDDPDAAVFDPMLVGRLRRLRARRARERAARVL